MSRAISVGKNAIRQCYPNPMVGCVIVCDNKIISEGFTSPFGGPHAEVQAMGKVSDKGLLRKATLYVTLEPCAHYGNTPPCANHIVSLGIPRVVIGILDPNPKVSGKGVAILESAGIQVIQGVLAASCHFHHRRFLSLQNKQRPYIILKWAQSADAYMAPPRKNRTSYWISSPLSKQRVHKWRTEEHAVLIGAHTLVDDAPRLDARLWSGTSPIPIYIDRDLSLPQTAPLFSLHKKIICITDLSVIPQKGDQNITYLPIDFKKPLAEQIANALFLEGISSVIVEGGAKTLSIFIQENIWDEARIFHSKNTLGTGIKAVALSGKCIGKETIEQDLLHYIKPHFDL